MSFDVEALLGRFEEFASRDAVAGGGGAASYREILQGSASWEERLGILAGEVVALEADFSIDGVALLLALARAGAIAVPLASYSPAGKARFLEIARVQRRVRLAGGAAEVWDAPGDGRHELYERLRAEARPGVVLFSSGSTGERKAVVHDLARLLGKFARRRPAMRTLCFLQLDHIGGLNTLLHTLANGGCAVFVEDRTPDAVLTAVERQRVELLPATPTFLSLLLVSGAHRRHDTSSLRTITYGTEPMPPSTLVRLAAAFPGVRLQQTYGLSELGILRSSSRESGSLWMRVGGEEFRTRVVDGRLEVQADSAMLGYLNAPSPFTPDGWYPTGDAVEVDGEYVRIVGRASDVISVGGENVYPAEVEGALEEMDEVVEAVVRGEPHPLTGQVVGARVRWTGDEPLAQRRARIRRHCAARLDRHAVPVKIEFAAADEPSSPFKKKR